MNDHEDHDHGSELGEMQLRVRALETILIEKRYVDPAALDEIVETFQTRIGPRIGGRIVARAERSGLQTALTRRRDGRRQCRRTREPGRQPPHRG